MNAINTELSMNFKNEHLQKATEKILSIYQNAAKYAEEKNREIAKTLAEVAAKKSYTQDGFKSVSDYANSTFGISKQNAYALASAGKFYNDSKTDDTLRSLSPSKLAAVASVDKKDLENAVKEGKITAQSTQKELKELASTLNRAVSKKVTVVVDRYTAKAHASWLDRSTVEALSVPRIEQDWDSFFTNVLQFKHPALAEAGILADVEIVKLSKGYARPDAKKATLTRKLYLTDTDSIVVTFYTYTAPKATIQPPKPKYTREEILAMLAECEAEEAGEAAESTNTDK